ncbi:MAG: hypothetical protein LBG62_05395 [Candidatus Methanoplasma sp.]|jgi:hypothetical protein|nr:hypothetical protein [Candidatus Methanoplasma sp.]
MATSGASDPGKLESLRKEVRSLRSELDSLRKMVEMMYCMLQEDCDDGECDDGPFFDMRGFNT